MGTKPRASRRLKALKEILCRQVTAADRRAAFLRRCGTAFDAGLVTAERLCILDRLVEFALRLETGQTVMALDLLNAERERLKGQWPAGTSTGGMGPGAGDSDGYACLEFVAILTHPCQLCAEDVRAWWTRPGFCEHRKVEGRLKDASGGGR